MVEQKRRNAGAEPISRHPLFPAIVALWCGALFGLGSIVVSPSVIESLVLATGIDKVIPMAAPPLGTTTRILLALAATGLGALVGFVAARRLARPTSLTEARNPAVDGAESPDAAPAEASDEAEAPRPGRIAGRRRALALNTENDLAAFDEHAPIPGHEPVSHDPQILNVAEFDLDGFEDAAPAQPEFRPHLPAVEIDETEAEAALPAWLDAESAWHDPAPAWAEPEPEEQAEPEEAESHFADHGAGPFTPPGAQVFQQVLQARLAEDAAHDETPQVAPGFKLLPRLHSGEPAEADAPEPVFAEPQPEAALDLESPVVEEAEFEDVTQAEVAEEAAQPAFAPHPDRRIAEADLDDLSPVELLERLALAMAERREQARLAAEAAQAVRPIAAQFTPLREVPPSPAPYAPTFERLAPAPFAAPAPFDTPVIDSDIDAQDTIAAPANDGWIEEGPTGFAEAPAAAPAFVPAALRPVFDDHADDEALPGYVPPRHIGLTAIGTAGDTAAEFAPFPASPFADESAEADEDVALAQGYSSLLNLSRHAAPHRNLARAIRFEHEEESLDDEPATDMLGDQANDAVPFARPTLAPQPQDRLFDAPGSSEAPDQEATERALRAALATLQRMSGAA